MSTSAYWNDLYKKGCCSISETEACHGELLDKIQYAPITIINSDPYLGVHFGLPELYDAISARFPGAYHLDVPAYMCKGGGMFVERMSPGRDMVILDPCLGLRQVDRVEFMETVIAVTNPDRKIIIISADTEAFVLTTLRAIRQKRILPEVFMRNEIIMEPDEELPYYTPHHYYQWADGDGDFVAPVKSPHDWRTMFFD